MVNNTVSIWIQRIRGMRLWKLRISPRVWVFLFFLVISTIFWFLNALSKDYTTTIAYPVKYNDFPEDKILIGTLPEHLQVQLTGYGFTLLQIKMGMSVKPLPFKVRDLSMVHKTEEGSNAYYYLTEFSRNIIANELPPDIKVHSIKPDSIIFRFDEMASKQVPVDKQNLEFKFRRQYMQTGPLAIEPDSVTLWGAEAHLDTIRQVIPSQKVFTDLHKPVNKKVPVREMEGIRVEPPDIKVQMPVAEFTEKTLKLPVYVRNLPANTNVKLFPDNVRVTFYVGLQDFSRVKQLSFRVVVDYEDIRSGISNKVRVRLTEKPAFIQNMRIYPEYLEYIIEK